MIEALTRPVEGAKDATMCKWGTRTRVRVWFDARMESRTGKSRWVNASIDSCIAPIVKALQAGGINMLSSCCGHGTRPGEIRLADGRVLLILPAPSASAPQPDGLQLNALPGRAVSSIS